MRRRGVPVEKLDDFRAHLLELRNRKQWKSLDFYRGKYSEVLKKLQPKIRHARVQAIRAALTPFQREKIKSRRAPKNELKPNGEKNRYRARLSVGDSACFLAPSLGAYYEPLLKHLKPEEDIIFLGKQVDNYRALENELPVEEWTSDTRAEYIKQHVLEGSVGWLAGDTLAEYRRRFTQETKELSQWRNSSDLPVALSTAEIVGLSTQARSVDTVKKSRSTKRSRRERRLIEEALSNPRTNRGGQWLQHNTTATNSMCMALFMLAYRALSTNLWVGLQAKQKSVLSKLLLGVFTCWYQEQNISVEGPELFESLIKQARTFLEKALVYAQSTESIATRDNEALFDFTRRVRSRLAAFWNTRYLSRIQQRTGVRAGDFMHSDNSVIYREWLVGAARHLGQTQTLFTAASYGPREVPSSIDYGRPRARFPGAGREDGGYEAFLHAFVKQTASSRFRRTSTLRFLPIFTEEGEDYQENLLLLEQSRSMRQRHRLARKLSKGAYFSAIWREVLTLRANFSLSTNEATDKTITNSITPPNYGNPAQGNTKRRFASTSITLLFDEERENELEKRNRLIAPNRAQSTELLRQALEARENDLDFLNFQQAVGARRLPLDMPISEREYRAELEDATMISESPFFPLEKRRS